jgi:hypothetical protein
MYVYICIYKYLINMTTIIAITIYPVDTPIGMYINIYIKNIYIYIYIYTYIDRYMYVYICIYKYLINMTTIIAITIYPVDTPIGRSLYDSIYTCICLYKSMHIK